MFEHEITRLQAQGFTSTTIAQRLSVPPSYVRAVMWGETGCDVKPLYNATAPRTPDRLLGERPKRVSIARRANAKAKRADALRALAEAEAALRKLG
jgi:hypothetical protein